LNFTILKTIMGKRPHYGWVETGQALNSEAAHAPTPAGFQYSATAANAFDHSVKRRVLAIDWIVRITHQILLRGHLIGPRLAMADRCFRH
jgi:hypothetical protein